VSIDVIFYVNGNKRYDFDAGRTTSSGVCVAPYRVFEATRAKNQRIFLMDYNTSIEDCDPEVSIHVPTKEELHARYEAVRKWFPHRALRQWLMLRTSNNDRVIAQDVWVKLEGRGTTTARLLSHLH